MVESVGKVLGSDTRKLQENIAKRETAFEDGKTLYSELHGYTSKTQQETIKRIIKDTDSAYVGKLLSGYNEARNDFVAETATTGAIAGGCISSTTIAGAVAGITIGGATGAAVGAASNGDRFFKQMASEYSFPKKDELMMDMAKKCHEKLQKDSKPDIETKEGMIRLERVINQGKIYDSDLDNLDDIAIKIQEKDE